MRVDLDGDLLILSSVHLGFFFPEMDFIFKFVDLLVGSHVLKFPVRDLVFQIVDFFFKISDFLIMMA